ncbi:MAG: RHS repeat-associated core domain-containing protein [Pyrinomonadaceae bacterium]
MSKSPFTAAGLPLSCLRATALLLALLTTAAYAQTASATDGTTPAGLKAGAPAGNYSLSGFDSVNLYSGNLNFQLPLLGVGGRGGAGMTMTLSIDSVKWKVDKDTSDGLTVHSLNPNWWEGLKPGYGPGVLQGRRDCKVMVMSNQCGQSLTRLTFTTSGGTEYELRDQLYGGQPKGSGAARGKVFVSADGTAATFLSDANISDPVMAPSLVYPSGLLMLADGTRYRIDLGVVTWMRDRNGNRMAFAYDPYYRVTNVTDSLNRQVTVTYANLTTVMYDQITYKGFGGEQRTIKVWHSNLGQALRAGYSLQTYGQLFPELSNGAGAYDPDDVVSAVEMPDGRTYLFFYNPYGELARVALPTGGAVEYDYTAGSGVVEHLDDFHVYRRVAERRVLADGTNVESRQVYGATYNAPGEAKPWQTAVTVEHRGPTALLAKDRHYFYGSPTASLFEYAAGPKYPSWKEGREYQTEALDTDGTTVLRRTASEWRQRAAVGWWAGSADEAPANDPRVVETVATVEPGGANLVSKTTSLDPADSTGQTVGFDRYNNRTDVWEYGYGATPGTVGALVRRTHTDYLTTNTTGGTTYDYACDPSTTCANANITAGVVHIRRLPAQSLVYDAAGAVQARTAYEYDNYAADALHAPLIARTGISGLDAAFTAGYLTRGNVTLTTGYGNAASSTGAVSSAVQYDVAGNAVKTIDARGYATTFDFSDHFGAPDGEARLNTAPAELSTPGQTSYAFMTKVTNALGHTSYGQYDYYLGKPVDGEDTNGVVTSGYYNDPLDRAKRVVRAVGTAAQSQTTFVYDLAARAVTTTGDLNNYDDNLLKSQTLYDGLGRTVETRQYESAVNYTTVGQVFDALGRVSQSSNPYRPWQGESPVWTTTDYDALGRAWKVTTPDGAKAITHFDGARVLVTDATGRQRMSKTDALGRLTDVWEVRQADGATEGVTFPPFADVPNVSAGYRTSYTYDALGRLRKVEQGAQSRFFMYDSLGRLLRAKNPEQAGVGGLAQTDPVTNHSQWSLGYTYDANSNLLTKTDARNVSVTYAYDALNRNTTADYSDTAVSPDVTRVYDTASNGKGRLRFTYAGGNYSQGSTVEHTAFEQYDALGRPVVVRQYFKTAGVWGSAYESQLAYNLAGGVTTQTYPSGRTVSYQYDAAGRLNDFRGDLGDGVQRVYSTGIQYTPAGALRQEQFGTDTPVYNKHVYNVRQQLSEIRVGTTAGDAGWNRGAIINHYSDLSWAGSGTDNNATLKKQDVYVPNDDAITGHSLTTQFYTYDALSRLQSVREARGGADQWRQDYVLDRYGNRTINSSSWGGAPEPQYGVDAATNRLTAPAGYSMTYDDAGYLTGDNYNGGAGGGTRSYDAEGRMTQAQFVYGQTQTAAYTYNAEGQRTRRQMGAGGGAWQVYGAGGELVAEYAAGAAPSQPLKEYGYRGGELLVTAARQRVNFAQASNGGVTTAQGYTADGVFPGLHFQPAYANDGRRYASPQGDRYWRDADGLPSLIQVDFGVQRTIDEVDLYTLADHPAYQTQADPAPSQPFTQYGVTSFEVQYWTGSAWAAAQGGSVSGNSLVWRKVSFPAVTTSKIRVVVNGAADAVARVVEVEAWGEAGGASDVRWLVADQLGTPRMVLDRTGSLSGMTRHDYLPYGEELYAGVGGRAPTQGYAWDSTRQQFTGYERDLETGLDYAQARHFSSSQGRFTSPDPLGASMRSADPQSFNRYSYTGNDPVNRTDSTGLDWTTDASKWGGGSTHYQNNIAAMQSQLPQTRGASDFDWSPVDVIPTEPPAEEETEEAAVEEVTVTVIDSVEEIAAPLTPSQPCPPTGAHLAEDPTVQAAALQAMRDSRSGRPGAREQGGWIYVRKGKVIIIRVPASRGTEDSLDISNPPQLRGALLVGAFHTHPLVYDKVTDSYISGGPNPSTGGRNPDTRIMFLGIPGLVVAEVGGRLRITPYGPTRRGSNPDDAIPPSLIRGFPGNSADTRRCPP